MKRFLVLDSFRGLCAIAVMIYHSHGLLTFTEARFFRSADHFVEFFFILSGFVLAHTYAQRLNTAGRLRDFVISRTFRLYPMHLVMLLVFIGLEMMKMFAERRGITFATDSFTGPRALSEVIPNLLLIQSWWPGFNPMSFNFPSWSISVEYYLYLLFGVITLFAAGQARWIAVVIVLFSFVGLATEHDLMTQSSLKGLAGFFAGQLTYLLYQRYQAAKLSAWLANILEVGSLILIYCTMTYVAGNRDVILILLFCATVLVYSFEAGIVSAWLRRGVFEMLGRLSFSIYMIHVALLLQIPVILSIYAQRYGVQMVTDQVEAASGIQFRYIDTGSVWLNTILVVIPMLVTVGLATLTYRFIELPGIAMGKRLGKSRREPTIGGQTPVV